MSTHLEFVRDNKGKLKHTNETYDFPVMTAQETRIKLYDINTFKLNNDNSIAVEYNPHIFTD